MILLLVCMAVMRKLAAAAWKGGCDTMKPIAKVYTALLFLFLFAPILIMLVFSFNSGNSLSVLDGFSLYWYKELFHDEDTLGALRNTLILALCAALLSTIMGTAAAVGMNKLRSKYMKAAMNTVTNLPMVNPEIITGISLMLMFVFFGRLIGMRTSLNFGTMLIAHVTFCLPYVILQVLPKLRQMDPASQRLPWTWAAPLCGPSPR